MAKFRKKPVVIEAHQVPALEAEPDEFMQWADNVGFSVLSSERDGCLAIKTLEGTMTAEPGDWIIKGVKGEFYPCKPDIFAATYEAVEEGAYPTGEAK